jgi:hypothetical protein
VQGYEATPRSFEQFTAFIRRENTNWAEVVERTGLKAE